MRVEEPSPRKDEDTHDASPVASRSSDALSRFFLGAAMALLGLYALDEQATGALQDETARAVAIGGLAEVREAGCEAHLASPGGTELLLACEAPSWQEPEPGRWLAGAGNLLEGVEWVWVRAERQSWRCKPHQAWRCEPASMPAPTSPRSKIMGA